MVSLVIKSRATISGSITPKGGASIQGGINSRQKVHGNLQNTFLKGLSAYEVAVKNGFEGSEGEWLATLAVSNASETKYGIMKLYDYTGENIDGTMTQRSITHAIADSAAESISAEEIIEITA